MNLKFPEIETSVMSKLNQSFSAFNRGGRRREPSLEIEGGCIEEEEEQDVSPQFLQTQNNQLFDEPVASIDFETFFQSLISTAQKTELS